MKRLLAALVIFGGIFDGDTKKKRIAKLEALMSEPTFWDDQAAAQKVIAEANRLKSAINPSEAFCTELEDLQAMLELVDEMNDDPDAEGYAKEILDSQKRLQQKLEKLELASFLSGQHDGCNAFLNG